jgi:hypothetical protein
MTPLFRVETTSHFDRLFKKLVRRHPELAVLYARALDILSSDPHNRTRSHPIRKLENMPAGEGRFRLRLRRFRFRYDIPGQLVILKVCSLRSEATYR